MMNENTTLPLTITLDVADEDDGEGGEAIDTPTETPDGDQSTKVWRPVHYGKVTHPRRRTWNPKTGHMISAADLSTYHAIAYDRDDVVELGTYPSLTKCVAMSTAWAGAHDMVVVYKHTPRPRKDGETITNVAALHVADALAYGADPYWDLNDWDVHMGRGTMAEICRELRVPYSTGWITAREQTAKRAAVADANPSDAEARYLWGEQVAKSLDWLNITDNPWVREMQAQARDLEMLLSAFRYDGQAAHTWRVLNAAHASHWLTMMPTEIVNGSNAAIIDWLEAKRDEVLTDMHDFIDRHTPNDQE